MELSGEVSTEANLQPSGGAGFANLHSNYSTGGVVVIGSGWADCNGSVSGDQLLGTSNC
jgi:hypothetical protein